MKPATTTVAFVAAAFGLYSITTSGAESPSYRLDAQTVSSGVAPMQSSSFRLESTLGDIAAGVSTSASHRNHSGFQVALFGVQDDSAGENITALITSYYQSILGRMPEASGLLYWQGEADRVRGLGVDVREVFFAMSLQFFNSPEYLNRQTSDSQYLTDLYRTFFSREPDAAGLAYWQTQLTGGMDRGALLTNFLFSPEFSNKMRTLFGEVQVRAELNVTIDLYRGILGVLPDSAGFNYWLGRMRAAQCQGGNAVIAEVGTLARLFVASQEYANKEASRPANERAKRHVGDLYNAFMRRGADLSGYTYWANLIANGSPRDGVMEQFLQSPEFQARVQAVISAGCAS